MSDLVLSSPYPISAFVLPIIIYLLEVIKICYSCCQNNYDYLSTVCLL